MKTLIRITVIVMLAISVASAQKKAIPKAEKTFSFSVQKGVEIKATVFPATEYGKDRKFVAFVPPIKKTDGNLYNASLQTLSNVYGKKRGLFFLKDTKIEYDSKVGGSALYWYVSNPKQRFYVFPVKDEGMENIFAIVVWLK